MCTKGDEGDTTDIAYPSLTKNSRHEVELVVAIGTRGKNIAVADEAKHVYGYAIGLEMTRHYLQDEAKNRPTVGDRQSDQCVSPNGAGNADGDIRRDQQRRNHAHRQ